MYCRFFPKTFRSFTTKRLVDGRHGSMSVVLRLRILLHRDNRGGPDSPIGPPDIGHTLLGCALNAFSSEIACV
jgi:hypothetical protein